MFSRKKVADTVQEIANHLQLVENVKAIQQAQREMADAIAILGDKIRHLESEQRASKAETTLDCLRETQNIVNSVQGGLYQRIESLSVRLAMLENSPSIDGNPSRHQLPGSIQLGVKTP